MVAIHRHARVSSSERRKRFGVLLTAIIIAFAVQGIATPSRWEQFFVSVLLALTLLLSLRVAEARAVVVRPVAALSALLVVLSAIEAILGHTNTVTVRLANLLLVTLTPPAII